MIKTVNIHYSVELNEEDVKRYKAVDKGCDPEIIAFWDNICKEKGKAIGCGNWWINKTNGDKIRGMTDEELAEWLAKFTDCNECPADAYPNCTTTEMACSFRWLDWLQEDVSDGIL